MPSFKNINQKGSLALRRSNKPRFASEAGVGHLLLIFAVLGLIAFLLVSNTFNFKDQFFSTLFPKPQSRAASDPISTPTPKTFYRMFVTNTQYNGNLGGLAGADQKCQQAADSVNLGGVFKTWISSSSVPASSRLFKSTVQYKLLNNTIVANNWADLTDGTIQNPININEKGIKIDLTKNHIAWTNTLPNGNISQTQGSCQDWTRTDQQGRGGLVHGNTYYTSIPNSASWWTESNNSMWCTGQARLYCIEQPDFSLSPSPSPSLPPSLSPFPSPSPSLSPSPSPSPLPSPSPSPSPSPLPITVTVNKTSVEATINRPDGNNGMVDAEGITIYTPYDTKWDLTTEVPDYGYVLYGLIPQVGELKTGQSAKVSLRMVFDNNNFQRVGNKEQLYTGEVTLRYTKPDGVWAFGPKITYKIKIAGEIPPKKVFVTSNNYSGNLGGILGADYKCQSSADAASLGGKWKAWISDSTVDSSPNLRFRFFEGKYKLLNGVTVAADRNDLFDSYINPINITEYNTYKSNYVWTNTLPNGVRTGDQDGPLHCNNWQSSSSSGFERGRTGHSSFWDGRWTWLDINNCNLQAALYCFEQ